MNTLNEFIAKVKTPDQRTKYIVGANLLANLHKLKAIRERKNSGFFLLTDKNVFKLFGNKVISSLKMFNKPLVKAVLPAGENQKSFDILSRICQTFLNNGLNKKSSLITLGGGVISDIGGFLSSILLRGIDCIHLPTTLLSQVDAAIGGKSGVNLSIDKSTIKNMIGTIRQPNIVISDIETLNSLPEKEIKNGLGEIVKYWIGWGKPTQYQISNIKYKISEIVEICQRIKLGVVRKDPLDLSGERQKLNLGHTIGHAIESALMRKISHGEAVSIGLVGAVKISVLKGFLDNKKEILIIKQIKQLGLPTAVSGITKDKVKSLMRFDKKNGTFVLIKDIGELETGILVEEKIINKVLDDIIL